MCIPRSIHDTSHFFIADIGSQVADLPSCFEPSSDIIAHRIPDRGGPAKNLKTRTHNSYLARRTGAPFGMDFTTVDMAETADGPIVFEVSACGRFLGAKVEISIDAATLCVEHVLSDLRKNRGKKSWTTIWNP